MLQFLQKDIRYNIFTGPQKQIVLNLTNLGLYFNKR